MNNDIIFKAVEAEKKKTSELHQRIISRIDRVLDWEQSKRVVFEFDTGINNL